MASVIEICNTALSHIGEKTINSLTDRTPAAKQCNLLYSQARDFVLQDFEWSFAEKRLYGALLSSVTPVGYEYAYQYPVDCLQLRRIYQSVSGAKPIKYIITASENLNTKMILTDQETAMLVYTAKVTDPTMFSEAFRAALSHKLAADLAFPITKSAKLERAKLQIYTAYIGAAQVADAQESAEEIEVDDDFLSSRL